MQKVLFLQGSVIPNDKSYSSQVLLEFQKKYKAAHPEDQIEFVNLNDTKFASTSLTANNFATFWNDVDSDFWIQKLKDVDKVVISTQMINFGPAAVVKNFIDGIAVANKTFSYKYSKKGEAKGLLDHLSVMVIASQGAPKDWYQWGSHIQWLKGTWNFLGAKKVDSIEIYGTKVEPINQMTPQELASSLEEEIQQKAQTF
ncbi:FMN-dependent NADH-azoreductase [Mycoplasmopsis sturni]|uniref:FMN-dependent NADH-azoreductase n=1 Tax=Mycoplasmopsis sturni TaxID=39047 RepID=UPI00056D9C8D|nr:FMN-dependent NADH-azoreductase [Mycoplasmopsis sturni]